MKTINIIASLVFAILVSCEKTNPDLTNPALLVNAGDNFMIRFNDSLVINQDQIDFYDFSSQLIYLKTGHSFSPSGEGLFTVLVDSSEIYSGKMLPSYSSLLYMGPIIRCTPSFYGDYLIYIGFIQLIDSLGNKINEDPRSDIRIIETLKKLDKYRAGLSCEIKSVERLSSNSVKVKFLLTNNDPFNLYYLDPGKMGINLFHYFTNGLFLTDQNNKTYTHNTSYLRPEPRNAWKNDWLSVLKSKESRVHSIIYGEFETIPPGYYKADFSFPGLSNQVTRDEFQKDNGRIWLGDLYTTKKIFIK